MSTDGPMRIGDLAREVGINSKTIRYYEEIGLLPKATRSEGGYRLYGSETLDLLKFIKRAQGLGLALSEIKELAGIHAAGNLPCSHLRGMLETKVAELDEQIREIKRLRKEMSRMLRDWDNQAEDEGASVVCPHIEVSDIRRGSSSIGARGPRTRLRSPGKGRKA